MARSARSRALISTMMRERNARYEAAVGAPRATEKAA